MIGHNIQHFNHQLLNYIKFGRNYEATLELNQDTIKVFDKKGTLLHYAAEYNNEVITRHLIEMGLDVDFINSNSKTPLMIAVEKRSSAAVEILLEANASIDIVDAQGKSALHLLFASELFDPDIFKQFIRRFERQSFTIEEIVENLSKTGISMYHAAFTRNIKVTQGLLDRGVDVNSNVCIHKMTALHVAVQFDDLNLVEWLLRNNADVNALNRNGRGPLYEAASRGNVKLVRLLLENGANPNVVNTFDRSTPLYAAFASSANPSNNNSVADEEKWNKCVEILLRNGAIPRDPIDWRMPMLFDYALVHIKSKRLKYLICHLALLDKLDESFQESVVLRYHEQIFPTRMDVAIEYYERCRKILRLKLGKITLFDLLTASNGKMRIYVRNETYLPALWTIIFGLSVGKNYSYYSDMLKDRIRKVVETVKLEDSVITVLCELMNLHYNLCYNIARKIIGYLSEHDLRQLSRVSKMSDSVTETKGEAKSFIIKYLSLKSIKRQLWKR